MISRIQMMLLLMLILFILKNIVVPVTNTPTVISYILNKDKYFDFELDTGAMISVINEVTAKKK